MSIFLNEKDKLDINELRDYNGKDEVKQILSANYQDIQNRFFSKGLPVVFLHPGIKKGEKIKQGIKAISQESLPWKLTIKTKMGDVAVRYCEVAEPQQFGGFKFFPSHIDFIQPKWTYFEQDIDKILVLMLTGHYKQGTISIVDTSADETKKAEGRGKSAIVAFHIFSEGGDLFGNEKKLDQFCLSWGISIKGKFPDQKKNALADAIEVAEKNHDWNYGYKAFGEALKDNDPYFEIRASVQDALDKQLIHFDAKKYQVQYKNGEVLAKIPVDQAGQWKKVLFEFLAKNPDKLSVVEGSVEAEPLHEIRKVELKEPVTEEYLRGKELSFFDKKVLVREIRGLTNAEVKSFKQVELEDILVEHYIVQKKPRP
jgi:hypothetical protein